MKKRRLDKWTIAERVFTISTGIIGAYFLIALILSILGFIKDYIIV